jgi:arylsulfatase A-like enzyme
MLGEQHFFQGWEVFMKQKWLMLALLVLGVAFIGVGWWLSREAGPAPPPNVAFLLIDTVRADRVLAERNGVPVMPNLARWTREGLWFPNAVSNCSWTKPAMASIFTSQYVLTHGILFGAEGEASDRTPVLPEALETMAEYLDAKGYATCAVQTNNMVKKEVGFAQGFPHCYSFGNGMPGDWVTDNAIASVAEMDQPFFLYAHYMDAHAPYLPPEAFRDDFGPLPADLPEAERELLLDGDRFMQFLEDSALVAAGARQDPKFPPLSQAGKEATRQLYDTACRYLDAELARLVDHLRSEHPETLIVIVSDHGEEFWERGGMGHGTTLHAEQLNVPLLVLGPEAPVETITAQVETLDILPTVAALLGKAHPAMSAQRASFTPRPQWQGQSLLAPREGLKEALFALTKATTPQHGVHQESVIVGGYKLIVDHARGLEHLYHVTADPQELHDLAADQPERVAALKALLAEHATACATKRDPGIVPEVVGISEEEQERLKALGYAGG